ncbi:response regulator transcription factor [Georgenia sp. SYP-B2076]|uniref:response regulator transcription factor n=1 Tax=Georgenia sp. SYP-B2076 TaxID=2495881 RepID=UPI000F8E7687|nr:LuxR C-terminal-related transcriptional regulator [Georgenia sp. SYP-B2076]
MAVTSVSAPSAGTPTSGQVTVAVVVDHPAVVLGVQQILAGAPALHLLGAFPTVATLVDGLGSRRPADVVLLDLQLADGSSPGRNIAAVTAAGAHVLLFAAGGGHYLHRLAAANGMRGVVHKTAPAPMLVEALTAAGRGEQVGLVAADLEWSRGDAPLSPRERETLALYAAGEKSERVAQRLGISRETVNDYVARIRAKYRTAGRAADTKVDLYKRAVEDGILPPPGYPEL